MIKEINTKFITLYSRKQQSKNDIISRVYLHNTSYKFYPKSLLINLNDTLEVISRHKEDLHLTKNYWYKLIAHEILLLKIIIEKKN